MRAQRGFSLLETVVALAIAAMLAVALVAMFRPHPVAIAQSLDDYDAAIGVARTLAVTTGRGTTLAFEPSGPSGFTLRVYAGRPQPGDRPARSTIMPVSTVATVEERTLGSPPFSLFFAPSGHVSGIAAYPLRGTDGAPRFTTIAREPACPPGGFVLRFALPAAAVTRELACSPLPHGLPGPPNPSPTPNRPIVTPASLLYFWPADATRTFVTTEWGYAHWFAATSGFACGTGVARFPDVLPSPFTPPMDPAQAFASPPPPPNTPYSFPNSFGGSGNDAPAAFPLQPAGEGTCDPVIADDADQHASTNVRVMGWLTATYGSRTYRHRTNPALSLPSSAFAQKGATVTIETGKTFDSEPLRPAVAFDAACAAYVRASARPGTTPREPSRTPARAFLTLTLASLPRSPVACGGTIYDQYPGSLDGEGIAFNATLGTSCPVRGNVRSGPADGSCDDLYVIPTGTTETPGWIEESEVGFYAPHGTPGAALYQWTADNGTCTVQQIGGTDFASWSLLFVNGNPSPPPVESPQPVGNPAGFGVADVAYAAALSAAPDPKPTQPPALLCRPPPVPSPSPAP